jgi:hypothetical protein
MVTAYYIINVDSKCFNEHFLENKTNLKFLNPLTSIQLFKTRSKIFQFLKQVILSLIKRFKPLSASYDA